MQHKMATSLSRMMKKAASSVIQLANRRTPHRNYTSVISATTNLSRQVSRATLIPCSHQHNSTDLANNNPDDTLLSVLESVIVCAEDKVHEAPNDFPFKIEDNGWDSITLSREYQGEEIQVSVRKSKHSGNSVKLDVCVSKKSGQTLEFNVAAEATEGITINYFTVKKLDPYEEIFPFDYDRPTFLDLEESLQKALYPYLQVRGIEPSIGRFLCDYMKQKKQKRYSEWLKNFQNFIAE